MKLLATVLSALILLAGFARAAEIVKLRGDVIVDADVILLGDLFTVDAAAAKTPVAHAPTPGQKVAVDMAWLAAIARQHSVDWQPVDRYARINISRTGALVTRAQVEAAISAALRARGLGQNMEIDLGRKVIEIAVPGSQKPTIGVRDISYDARSGRFTALLIIPESGPGASQLTVTGQAMSSIDIPMLARDVLPGVVITADDLTTQRVRTTSVHGDMIANADEIVGSAPRRTLRAGEMLRKADLRAPILVTKGSLVMVTYRTAAMTLTAQGKALANGGEGDVIALVNTRTNATIEGRVVGPNAVVVIGPASFAAN